MRSFKNEWKHLSENAMAANPHPTFGGIIDKMMAGRFSEEWFIVFNHPDLSETVKGLSSKAEAFEVHAKTLAAMGIVE